MLKPKGGEFVIEQTWPAPVTTGIKIIIEGKVLSEAGQRLIGLFQDGRSYRITCWMGWEEVGSTDWRYRIRIEWQEMEDEDQTWMERRSKEG